MCAFVNYNNRMMSNISRASRAQPSWEEDYASLRLIVESLDQIDNAEYKESNRAANSDYRGTNG